MTTFNLNICFLCNVFTVIQTKYKDGNHFYTSLKSGPSILKGNTE